MKEKFVCSYCGALIQPQQSRFFVGNKYLQNVFFNNDKENIFCSMECICSAISVFEVDNRGNVFPV